MPEEKKIHVKPTFYAHTYMLMKAISEAYGYNLLLNGSMNRDLDLVAVPWAENPKDEMELIKALDLFVSGSHFERKEDYLFKVLPGGRKTYVINLNRGGAWNGFRDKEYYLDISITPLGKQIN